ncbi:glycoside hydrolase family 26 protein [Methylobacterium flocculans]|uniref:hypothetical protein n=1 Tax=Methylobacterium flocculans TaxID=2984843 RepID=UPI0021F2CF2F|nr:hypothetical protein [Methylobacterium sp. FF17]
MTEAELLDGLEALNQTRRQALGTLAGAAVAVTSPVAAAPTLPARLRGLGVFSPMYAGAEKLSDYLHWLGRQTLPFVSDNAEETKGWSEAVSSTKWLCGVYAKLPTTLILGVPILPRYDAGKFADGNAGKFDASIWAMASSAKPLLDRSVSGKPFTIIIRPGWEGNGNWMPWFAGTDPVASGYVAYVRRCIGIFRQVDPRFTFSWCNTLGWMHVDAFKTYWGDDVTDFIDTDVYDEAWEPRWRTDLALRWKERFWYGDNGLDAYAKFAAKKGKKRSFSEWGCRNFFPPNNAASGGDNPYFIEQMAAHFDALGDKLAFHCYFERADQLSSLSAGKGVKDAAGIWQPTPTLFPKAAARYKVLFGA